MCHKCIAVLEAFGTPRDTETREKDIEELHSRFEELEKFPKNIIYKGIRLTADDPFELSELLDEFSEELRMTPTAKEVSYVGRAVIEKLLGWAMPVSKEALNYFYYIVLQNEFDKRLARGTDGAGYIDKLLKALTRVLVQDKMIGISDADRALSDLTNSHLRKSLANYVQKGLALSLFEYDRNEVGRIALMTMAMSSTDKEAGKLIVDKLLSPFARLKEEQKTELLYEVLGRLSTPDESIVMIFQTFFFHEAFNKTRIEEEDVTIAELMPLNNNNLLVKASKTTGVSLVKIREAVQFLHLSAFFPLSDVHSETNMKTLYGELFTVVKEFLPLPIFPDDSIDTALNKIFFDGNILVGHSKFADYLIFNEYCRRKKEK